MPELIDYTEFYFSEDGIEEEGGPIYSSVTEEGIDVPEAIADSCDMLKFYGRVIKRALNLEKEVTVRICDYEVSRMLLGLGSEGGYVAICKMNPFVQGHFICELYLYYPDEL